MRVVAVIMVRRRGGVESRVGRGGGGSKARAGEALHCLISFLIVVKLLIILFF